MSYKGQSGMRDLSPEMEIGFDLKQIDLNQDCGVGVGVGSRIRGVGEQIKEF